MADWDLYGGRIASICQQWNKAEEDVKLAEQVTHKVVFPAINELRYAGRRIIEALVMASEHGPEEDVNKLFQDAEFDCLRARHDAIDAASSKIALDLEIASRKLGFKAILEALPDFVKLYGSLDKIREEIKKSRGNRNNRENIYAVIEVEDFDSMVKGYNEFKRSEPIMKQLAARDRRLLTASYFFGFCGVVSSVIMVINWLK